MRNQICERIQRKKKRNKIEKTYKKVNKIEKSFFKNMKKCKEKLKTSKKHINQDFGARKYRKIWKN